MVPPSFPPNGGWRKYCATYRIGIFYGVTMHPHTPFSILQPVLYEAVQFFAKLFLEAFNANVKKPEGGTGLKDIYVLKAMQDFLHGSKPQPPQTGKP